MEQAVEPITIRGPYLWKGNNRFLVRGVVYQLGGYIWDGPVPSDPIADDRLPELRHDIALFKELGVNTIYVYRIDNTKSHDQAMEMLQEAGIYVLSKVSDSRHCINRKAPYDSYSAKNLKWFFQTVDVLAKYPNTLGAHVANVLINSDKNNSKSCAPVLSAVVRDVKRYMKLRNEATGQRILPVGYGAATTNELDREVLHYLSSGDEQHRIDFWTASYSMGETPGLERTSYSDLIERYGNAGLPMFFAEYSSNNSHQPRLFEETLAIYSPQMTKVFSGGCVYEFWHNANRYGLVKMRGISGLSSKEDTKLIIDHERETDLGNLLVLKDFENYRAKLRATRDIEPNSDDAGTRKEEATSTGSNQSQTGQQQTLAGVGQVPESCINWRDIEEATTSIT